VDRHLGALRRHDASGGAQRVIQMKVLTAEQMREIDRRTMEMGVPGAVLMENAGTRVVEFLEEKFSPLGEQRILIF